MKEGTRVSISNKWLTIIDTVIVAELFKYFSNEPKSMEEPPAYVYVPVTKYLVSDEDGRIFTIFPDKIEVYEPKQEFKGAHVIS